MPPGGPNSRYIGAETAITDGKKWVLSRRPLRHRDFRGQAYHVAQEGASLDSIAHRKYEQWRHWQILADINQVIDPTQGLAAGVTVLTPPTNQIANILGDRSAAR